MLDWKEAMEGFKEYLQLQRGLSMHSVAAYVRDVNRLQDFLENSAWAGIGPEEVEEKHLQAFFKEVHGLGIKSVPRPVFFRVSEVFLNGCWQRVTLT